MGGESMKRYQGRKFMLAVGASIVSCIALFTEHLTGGEWIAAQTLILGMYKIADVSEKVFGKPTGEAS